MTCDVFLVFISMCSHLESSVFITTDRNGPRIRQRNKPRDRKRLIFQSISSSVSSGDPECRTDSDDEDVLDVLCSVQPEDPSNIGG